VQVDDSLVAAQWNPIQVSEIVFSLSGVSQGNQSLRRRRQQAVGSIAQWSGMTL
jgi:hypothetical protein